MIPVGCRFLMSEKPMAMSHGFIQSPFPSCHMGGDQVGLYDRHVGTPEIQRTPHKRGRLDQCLHVAQNKGVEGKPYSKPFFGAG
jgi:hypothetical protein